MNLPHQRALHLPDPGPSLVQLAGGGLQIDEDIPRNAAGGGGTPPPVVLAAVHVAVAEPPDVDAARGDLIHGDLVAGADHPGDDLQFLEPGGRGVVGHGEVSARAVGQQMNRVTQPRGLVLVRPGGVRINPRRRSGGLRGLAAVTVLRGLVTVLRGLVTVLRGLAAVPVVPVRRRLGVPVAGRPPALRPALRSAVVRVPRAVRRRSRAVR